MKNILKVGALGAALSFFPVEKSLAQIQTENTFQPQNNEPVKNISLLPKEPAPKNLFGKLTQIQPKQREGFLSLGKKSFENKNLAEKAHNIVYQDIQNEFLDLKSPNFRREFLQFNSDLKNTETIAFFTQKIDKILNEPSLTEFSNEVIRRQQNLFPNIPLSLENFSIQNLNQYIQIDDIDIQKITKEGEKIVKNSFENIQNSFAEKGYYINTERGNIHFKNTNSNSSFSFNTTPKKHHFSANIIESKNTQTVNIQGSFGNMIQFSGAIEINDIKKLETHLSTIEKEIQEEFNALLQTVEMQKGFQQGQNDFENVIQTFSKKIPRIFSDIEDYIDHDFEIQINFRELSKNFKATGNYKFADILLEALGHDIGTLTITKSDIDTFLRLQESGNSADIADYWFTKITGRTLNEAQYDAAQRVGNSVLENHFRSRMTVTQNIYGERKAALSFDTHGGVYGAVEIGKTGKTMWTLIGGINQKTFVQIPVFGREDNAIFGQVEIKTHSAGIQWNKPLYTAANKKTQVSTQIQLEALFIELQSARLLIKDNTRQEVFEVYKLNLTDDTMKEAAKMYVVPLPSAGVTLSQNLNRVFSLNGQVTAYPGLTEQGDIENIVQGLTVKYQANIFLVIDINSWINN